MISKHPSSISFDYKILSDLFSSPEKNSCRADKKAMTGHFPLAHETTIKNHGPDDKELWHICRFENILSHNETFFPKNILPKHIEAEKIFNLYRSLDVIANSYLDELCTLLPGYTTSFQDYKYGHNILRFLHYPVVTNPKPYAIPPHKDSSLFSVLVFQKGGEFRYRDGDDWKIFCADSNEVLILPGLLLEYITHGQIKAVEHTVNYVPGESRFSAVFFVHPKPHQQMELKFPNHENTFKTTCVDFLGQHAQELGIIY